MSGHQLRGAKICLVLKEEDLGDVLSHMNIYDVEEVWVLRNGRWRRSGY